MVSITLGGIVALLQLVPVTNAAADQQSSGMTLLDPTLASMLPGQQGWIAATWTSGVNVCQVRITGTGRDLTFAYPTNTGTYSSLYREDSLLAGSTDFAAFDITVAPNVTKNVRVNLRLSYGIAQNDGSCSDTSEKRIKAILPVQPFSGTAFTQSTTSVTISNTGPVWVQIAFTGNKPGLTNFSVSLAPPTGLVVTYPSNSSTTGLSAGSTLPVAGSDHVSVELDATGLSPGTYTVPMTISTGIGTTTSSLTVIVS